MPSMNLQTDSFGALAERPFRKRSTRSRRRPSYELTRAWRRIKPPRLSDKQTPSGVAQSRRGLNPTPQGVMHATSEDSHITRCLTYTTDQSRSSYVEIQRHNDRASTGAVSGQLRNSRTSAIAAKALASNDRALADNRRGHPSAITGLVSNAGFHCPTRI